MVHLTKILGFSFYHISKDDSTLCGLNLMERQFELCNKLPEDRGFICSKCKRIKNRHELTYQLDNTQEIKNTRDALKYYGNIHALFSLTVEMERVLFGLEEALEFSSSYLLDSLENSETQFEPSVNKNKIQLSYPVKDEIWNPEIEFSKLEFFSSVIKRRVFESLKERIN